MVREYLSVLTGLSPDTGSSCSIMTPNPSTGNLDLTVCSKPKRSTNLLKTRLINRRKSSGRSRAGRRLNNIFTYSTSLSELKRKALARHRTTLVHNHHKATLRKIMLDLATSPEGFMVESGPTIV